MPAYLSRMYREDASEVLAKNRTMIAEYGLERAVSMIEAKPTMIGKLKGLGMGSFSISSARDDAEANIEILIRG